MKAKDVMRKAVVVEPDISVKKAAGIISNKGISSLIVLKKDKMVGIVTEKDITRSIGKLGLKISSIMSKSVKSVDINDDLNRVASVLSGDKIRIVPVLEKGKLVGVIDVKDVIANSEDLNEEFLLD